MVGTTLSLPVEELLIDVYYNFFHRLSRLNLHFRNNPNLVKKNKQGNVTFRGFTSLDNRSNMAPGRVAQSVTCLTTDACLTADPGVASSIHTFVEIDHEIISKVILLPSADLFKKGCCQLQAKVCAQITG